MSDSWKISLPCTRAEAEAIDMADELIAGAVLMTTEEVEDDREHWRLDAYVEAEPDAALVAQVRALVPSAGDRPATVTHLPPEDWVTLSQAGLEPLSVGRFFVHSGAATVPADVRAFHIPAGRAFGTGHHETTSGCLAMLDGLAERRFASAIDVGTGTGLLAFAVAHLWPQARIVATDIDPVAIEVTAENAALNQVEGIELIVADGARDPAIEGSGPFDLVIANILAGPLVAMAPEVTAIAAPDAAIVLAGLLSSQADTVVDAYAAQGCVEARRLVRGDWTILLLTAPAERTAAAPAMGDRRAWATDTL